MKNMRYFKLVECSDYDVIYGLVGIEEGSKITVNDVQQKIYDIKNSEEFEEIDWCVDDIFEAFPEDWEVCFIPLEGTTIEI